MAEGAKRRRIATAAESTSPPLLILHAVVVPMDPERRILSDGAVAIRDGLVAAVGSAAECEAALKKGGVEEFETIDATDMLALPGLIDAHGHAGHALVRTLGGGDSGAWYRACHALYTQGSSEAFWEAEAEICALERLKCGVTTGVSLLGGGDSVFRTDDARYGIAHCRAVERVGTRSVVAVGVNRPPRCVPLDAEGTVRTEWVYSAIEEDADGRETATRRTITLDDQVKVCEELIERCHAKTAGGRIRFATCCPVHDPSKALADGVDIAVVDEFALKMRKLADAHEGVTFTQDGHKSGTVAYAFEHGLLGPKAYLSHCTDLSSEDFAALTKSGASVVHNPSAIGSIYGRCPAPELIDRGITVAIGSDGTAPDRSCDLFRHMQQCMHYHRRHFRDTRVMPPGKVLEMVTVDAARVLGLGDVLGSLEVGKKADLILVQLAAPHLAPKSMPLEQVIYFANGGDVDTVIIDGFVRMRGRRVLTVDEKAAVARATAEADKAIARCGLAHLREQRPGFWGCSRFAA